MNRVTLLGNLGTDPEVKDTTGGRKVLNMRIATSEFYQDTNGESQVKTTWHNIVAWGNGMIDLIQRDFKKGDRILIEGEIRNETYEKDGVKHHQSRVVLKRFWYAK